MANFHKIYDHIMQIKDDVQILIRANATPIKNELTQLGAELDKLKENQKQFTRGSKDYAEAAKEIELMKQKILDTAKAMDVTGMSVKQLTEEQRRLTKEFNEFGTGGERLHEVNTRLAEVKGSVRAVGTEVKDTETTLGKLKGWIMGAFAVSAIVEGARAIVSFGKEVFEIGAKFEKYEVVLTKAMGSQEKATKSMSDLQKLASNTPFTLDELTGSYVKLINRGLTPSMESMTKMGDLAASQGKGFDQLTEAILDAGTGEFERLKEFGISASKSGDQVELSFKGIQKTVKMTPEAMQGAIESFGELDSVTGMMAETMKTGEGQASNFNDKMDALKVMLYQELSPVFKGVIALGSQMLDGFISLVDWTKKLWNANQPLVEVIASLFRTMGNLVNIVWDAVAGITGMNKASDNAQKFLNGLKIVLGLVAAAASVLVGTIGLVIDGLRFLSGNISFTELRNNTSKNFSEIAKSLKATFVDEPKKIQGESKKAGEDLGKAHGDGLGTGQKKAQGETHKALSDKEKTHRESEAKKATEAAEKLAKEELDVRKKLADATDKVWFDSIEDQWEKKRLAIIREYEKDWETQKNLVGDKKELQADFAAYEIQLEKNRDAELEKLAAEKLAKEDKARADEKAKVDKAIADLIKGTKAAIADIEKAEKESDKETEKSKKEKAERIKGIYQTIFAVVNDSFSNTIEVLDSMDTVFAQSQAERLKGMQAGFNQIGGAIKNLKIDTSSIFDFVKGAGAESIGSQLGSNIAGAIGGAFTANPIAFMQAAGKLVDGVNSVLEANKWYNFSLPLKTIIADSKQAIEGFAAMLKLKLGEIEAEGERLLQKNDLNNAKLTAAALDFEAEQFGILVKSKEDLARVNREYSEEELRIKALYADELNSQDAARAEAARLIVEGLIYDLKISRNKELEDLIITENAKRDIQKAAADEVTAINKAADAELAELARTAATRTLEEQNALINAVEARRTTELNKVDADRQADLVKLMDYEGQKAEINRLADEALLAAKANTNNLSIAEQQRLVDEIEAKRKLDLGNLATSELGIEAIKKNTAAELKAISETTAAETFRIEAELKLKQKQAEWQHNAEVYQAQLQAWLAEKELTIALLRLQYIKAQGKIFSKSEMKAIEAALGAAMSSIPPMPPAGFFNYPTGNAQGGENKLENGGVVGNQFFNNGGIAQGPRHSQGGIWMWNPQTRQKVGELEGGEYIVNRRATAANLGLISQINNSALSGRIRNSSFTRTGQPAYEDGGVFSTFGPITLNQSNSKADETLSVLEAIMKATGATAKATEITANNTDATAKNTNALVDPIRESANNSRNLGSIASATRDTANKNFSPQISIINQQLELFRNIENSARL